MKIFLGFLILTLAFYSGEALWDEELRETLNTAFHAIPDELYLADVNQLDGKLTCIQTVVRNLNSLTVEDLELKAIGLKLKLKLGASQIRIDGTVEEKITSSLLNNYPGTDGTITIEITDVSVLVDLGVKINGTHVYIGNITATTINVGPVSTTVELIFGGETIEIKNEGTSIYKLINEVFENQIKAVLKGVFDQLNNKIISIQ